MSVLWFFTRLVSLDFTPNEFELKVREGRIYVEFKVIFMMIMIFILGFLISDQLLLFFYLLLRLVEEQKLLIDYIQ